MMTLLKCNQLLYALLSERLRPSIRGGVYTADNRPLDDRTEAIVIQTIAITHSYPQTAQGNIVVYVPDKLIRINGREQYVADNERLERLTALLIEEVEALLIEGVGISIGNENYFDIAEVRQHAVSLSISWNIQIHK